MDERLQLLVYAVLASCLMIPLLGPGYYLTLDMQFGPGSFSNHQFADFYGFAPSSYGAYFPYRMALSAVSAALGAEAAEKILIFSVFLLCGVSMHLAFPPGLGASRIYGGVLYMLNPFVFIRFLAGHWALLLSYALWPLAITWFLELLDRPDDRRRLAKAALITSLAAVSSHGVIMLLLAYPAIFLFRALEAGFEKAKGIAGPAALLAAIVLALNLYWIAPTILLFGETYKPAPAEAYLEDFSPTDRSLSAEAAIITMHGFWRGGFSQTKDVLPQWPYVFAILASLALAGLFFLFRSRPHLAAALAVISIAGFLLALGALGPLSWAFTLLGEGVPVYLLFRDSQKFVGLLCLAYAFLGAYGVDGIRRALPRASGPLLLAALAAALIFDFSMFGFQGQVGITQYPPDWYEAERVIASDPAQSYILVIPSYLYNTYPWLNSVQKTLGTPASQFFSKPVITSSAVITANVYGDTQDTWAGYVDYIFRSRQHINDTADLLAPLNIRYILIYKAYGDSEHYLWLFKRRGGVHDIELAYESDTLYLFRNNLAQGPILGSSDSGAGGYRGMVRSGDVDAAASAVTYDKTHPASIEILDSSLPYIIYSQPPGGFAEYNGKPAAPWHNVASVFEYAGPGRITNPLFTLTLGLFAFAWSLGLLLCIGFGLRRMVLAAVFGIAVFALAGEGILEPVHLGLLLMLSACLSLFALIRPARPAPKQL